MSKIHFESKSQPYGSAIYPKKVAAIEILPQLLENAEYSNFGLPKKNDPKELIGFLNFKAKCKINGKIEYVHLSCLMYSADKIFWTHEVNIKK